jgi:hypothetical protein
VWYVRVKKGACGMYIPARCLSPLWEAWVGTKVEERAVAVIYEDV